MFKKFINFIRVRTGLNRSKEYRNMMATHKKKILKQAKWAAESPWDWAPGLWTLVEHLYFMRDYYKLGENVWAAEDYTWDESKKDYPSRFEMLNQILGEWEEWQNCEDKYVKVVDMRDEGAQEEIDRCLADGYTRQERSIDKDNILKDVTFLYRYADHNENTEKFIEEYEAHREAFFALLSKYIECLWD